MVVPVANPARPRVRETGRSPRRRIAILAESPFQHHDSPRPRPSRQHHPAQSGARTVHRAQKPAVARSLQTLSGAARTLVPFRPIRFVGPKPTNSVRPRDTGAPLSRSPAAPSVTPASSLNPRVPAFQRPALLLEATVRFTERNRTPGASDTAGFVPRRGARVQRAPNVLARTPP